MRSSATLVQFSFHFNLHKAHACASQAVHGRGSSSPHAPPQQSCVRRGFVLRGSRRQQLACAHPYLRAAASCHPPQHTLPSLPLAPDSSAPRHIYHPQPQRAAEHRPAKPHARGVRVQTVSSNSCRPISSTYSTACKFLAANTQSTRVPAPLAVGRHTRTRSHTQGEI